MSVGRADARDIELVLHVINTSNSDAYRSIIPPEQFKDPILTIEQLHKEFENVIFTLTDLKTSLWVLPPWESKETRPE
jgi:hypothetical protein